MLSTPPAMMISEKPLIILSAAIAIDCNPEEQKRLLDIADVAENVERAVLAKPKPEGIIADTPSLLFSTFVKIAGARAGRALKTGTIQAPAFTSRLFDKIRAVVTKDPARRLLIDAMENEDLFAALLTAGEKAETKAARKQLNAWLLSIGAEQLSGDEQ